MAAAAAAATLMLAARASDARVPWCRPGAAPPWYSPDPSVGVGGRENYSNAGDMGVKGDFFFYVREESWSRTT